MTTIGRRDSSLTNQTQAFHGSHLRLPRRCERHPDLVRHCGELCRCAKGLGPEVRPSPMRRDSSRRRAAISCCRARTARARSAACCSGWKVRTKRRIHSFPAGWRSSCRTAFTALPTSRMTQGLPRSRSRSALPLHALSQGRDGVSQAGSGAEHRSRRSRSHRRSGDAGARSDQYAGERHGSGGARGGRAFSWPRATAPTSRRRSATICWSRIFR